MTLTIESLTLNDCSCSVTAVTNATFGNSRELLCAKFPAGIQGNLYEFVFVNLCCCILVLI